MPDPIGHDGGLNLYAYCDDNPVGKIDPKGTTPDWLTGWGNALHATAGFFFGVGPDRNVFTEQDVQGRQMRDSLMGQTIETSILNRAYLQRQFMAGGTMSGDSGFGYTFWKAGHLIPLIATSMEPGNGTQAQVGGFTWDARRSGDRVLVHVSNIISARSLFYQMPFVPNFDRFGSGFGPLGNVHQDFYWWMNVPAQYRTSKG